MTVTELTPVLQSYPLIGQWLTIDSVNLIHVRTGKVEYGQGIKTALAQIVAHELEVPVARVVVEDVTTADSPDEGVTSGSRSVEDANEGLRQVAAELRVALIQRAARSRGEFADRLTAVDGCVVLPDGSRIAYRDLFDEELERQPVTGGASNQQPSPASPLGSSVPRLDLPAKTFGRATFVHDLDMPGLLHARVCRPPSPGATLLEIDEADVSGMPGVVAVVRDGSFLGVLADREEQAIRALRRLRRSARWGPGSPLPDSSRFLLTEPTTDIVVAENDSPAAQTVDSELSAEYSRPYLAHASLGPSCAVAETDGRTFQVWTHSQGIFHLRQELAKVLDVAPESVKVHHREGAGCYGANGADDAALDAALLARSVPGRPVRVQWTRDDEQRWEPFGTPMIVQLRASLDADGVVVHWTQDIWGNGHRDRPRRAGAVPGSAPRGDDDGRPTTNLLAARHLEHPFAASVPPPPPSPSSGSGRNANPVYAFAARRVVNHYVPHTPIRVSALRSLGAHANVFAIESFMDEIATRLGLDPLEHRLRYLDDPRARDVLSRVTTRAEWERRPRDSNGRGLGIGFARYKNAGAYVAVVAEIEVAADLHLRRVWAACDAGLVVNPDGLANQLEGGVIQAASWTLKEEVRFSSHEITSRDWTSYPILTFTEVPELHVEIVSRSTDPPRGIGEAVAGPTAAAIGNAIFAASGVRLRHMPLTRERFIKAAAR